MDIEREFIKYFKKFETLQDFMVGDLRRSSLEARANFLVAMGIFNYIEILGSFYVYKSKYKYKSKTKKIPLTKRFDFTINKLFSPAYKDEFIKLRRMSKKSPYDMLRSGMTHEYLVKTYKTISNKVIKFSIVNADTKEKYNNCISIVKCGVKLEKANQEYIVNIYNPKLIEDLNSAFEEYKTRLKKNIGRYRTYFIKRAKFINLDLMPEKEIVGT